jgi:histidinol phosphatase-like PHP family hydrolase
MPDNVAITKSYLNLLTLHKIEYTCKVSGVVQEIRNLNILCLSTSLIIGISFTIYNPNRIDLTKDYGKNCGYSAISEMRCEAVYFGSIR